MALPRAAIETLLVISPYVIAALFRDQFDTPYLGPISIIIGVVIATILMRRRGQTWRDYGFRRPAKWWRTILTAIGAWVGIALVTSLIVFPILVALEIPPIDLSALSIIRDGGLVTFLIFLGPIAWGTAAFGEEFIARGFILNRFGEAFGSTRIGWTLAILIQGLIFGLAHTWQGLAGVVTISVVGFIYGAAYLLSKRNLWVVIIAHGLMDSISIIAIYAGALPTN